MSAGDFLKTTKGKVITIGGVAVVAIGILAAVLLQGNGYRSISVEQVEGSVNIAGQKNSGQAYVGEHLYSGDDVTVMDQASLTMCMDNDKYVYADANTHFSLEASGAKEDSRIKIYLDAGSELNELQSKLGPNDSYEVDTPNSTMSVRGTKFRVTVFETSYGVVYTLVEVENGEVLVRVKTLDGTYTGEEMLLTAGQSALIRSGLEKTEFVIGEQLNESKVDRNSSDKTGMLMLTYDALPKDGMERLIKLITDIETEGTGTGEDDQASGSAAGSDASVSIKAGLNSPAGGDGSTESADAANSAKTTPTPEPTKHVHNPGEWTVKTAAGCATDGVEERKCKDCGKVVETRPIPATGHTPGNWVDSDPATCTEGGTREQLCSKCGAVLATDTISPKGHNWGAWDGNSTPTCTSGSNETRVCMDCGATESRSEGALGHDYYLAYTEQDTLTNPGSVIQIDHYRCSRCGDEYTNSYSNGP